MQRTADGVPVILHDDTLDRTTTGHGRIREALWSDVRALDAGSWRSPEYAGERVPSLEELLAWAHGQTVDLVLELKQPAPEGWRQRDDALVPAVLDALRASSMLERTLMISFDHPSIAEALRCEPRARTALLSEGPTLVDPLALARAVPGVMGLHVRWRWISRELCDAAHDVGLHVHGWGLGHPIDRVAVRRMVDAGVDSLSADAPDELLAMLGR